MMLALGGKESKFLEIAMLEFRHFCVAGTPSGRRSSKNVETLGYVVVAKNSLIDIATYER